MMDVVDLITNILDQDFAKAEPTFKEVMGAKIDDALEQEKIAIADYVFNGAEVDEEEYNDLDDDITDEDMEAAIDELDQVEPIEVDEEDDDEE